ncbi:MAG: transposase, partial [Dehalococcoidia bacterium]|nr:transposase [Dehalococcoidia bacterium]
MKEKASMATRNEIITRTRLGYKKASRKERGAILDNLGATTGLSRSRIKHLLSIRPWLVSKPHKPRPGRIPKYGSDVKEALARVWMFMDNSCGKRLTAGMDDMLDALIRYGEVSYDEDTVTLLREMSSSTADRLLKRAKEEMRFKGISATKPGTLLKKSIPIRLGDEWDDTQPGYVEVDLVAHCGDTASGDYLNTLDMTDICTGWTETQTAINKAQVHVHKAIRDCAG